MNNLYLYNKIYLIICLTHIVFIGLLNIFINEYF